MRAFVAVLVISTVIGAVAFALSETTAEFRSTAAVALEENLPNDELDAARQPLVDALPAVLETIEMEGPLGELGDDVTVSLVVPENVSRVDVLATTSDAVSARILADRVAGELQRRFLADRRAIAQQAVERVVSDLEQRNTDRERQQDEVDLAIADEALATAEVQRASLSGADETRVRAERDQAIELVRTVAAERDDIADEENQLRAQLLVLELDVEMTQDAVFLVPGAKAENVTGSPVRNGVEAALIAAVTLLTAMSILYLARAAT